jgi:hypothetical protein
MTRWILLAVLVVAVSAAGTFFITSSPMADLERASASATQKPDGPLPAVVVAEDLTHHFTVMAVETSDSHVWTLKNEGQGDLVLKGGHASCTCTVPDLKEGETTVVKPGQAYKLRVEWKPKAAGRFQKTAQIFTNDPKHESLTFEIEGDVRPPIVMSPDLEVLDMMLVSNDKEHDYYLLFYSPDQPEMKILSATTTRPELLEVTEEPLDDQQKAWLKQQKARGGHKLRIRAKPTSMLGLFNEELVVKTDHPGAPEFKKLVTGRIVGPVSVIPTTVKLNVTSAKGATALATIMVVGQEHTNFDVEKKPENLKVAIAPVDEKSKAGGDVKSHAYRMTVTVPPGTPPGIIQEPIVLKTDNPKARELKVDVYIQVLGEI